MKLELVKLTKQPLITLTRLFLLVAVLVIVDAQADECTTMQFLKNKSQGISVQNNLCEVEDKVSVGSVFIMIPGARLWLKSQSAGNSGFQLICQNRVTRAVEVKFSNTVSPWIAPKGFAQCSHWINNKLSCADDRSTTNNFICATAVIQAPEYLKVSSLERTTSVKMRSINSDVKKPEISRLTEPELINAVVGYIRSEVELCRDLYRVEHAVNVTWALDSMHRIGKLSFANGNEFEQQFRSCAESVINNFSYPNFNEAVAFSLEF
jgi:hypothetical protein